MLQRKVDDLTAGQSAIAADKRRMDQKKAHCNGDDSDEELNSKKSILQTLGRDKLS
jgi:hypothetical protein